MIHSRTTYSTFLFSQSWLAMLCVVLSAGLTGVFSINASANNAVALAPEEQRLASKLAGSHTWQQEPNSPKNRPHKLGVQTLSIELDERKKNDHTRRARVYQFNYNLMQSRLVLIDLDNGVIVKQQAINTVHLPLNTKEISTARSLVEQQSQLMEKVNQSRLQRGLAQMSDLSTIEVKASIFEPDDPEHTCATQRCALISLFDQTRTVFSVEPLVNLQSLSVSTLQQSL